MFALPRMSRNEAQARSLIASRGRDCPMLGDGDWRLTLEPASLACPPLGLDAAWQVKADWSGARFVVEVPEQACIAWINHSLPGLEVLQLPDALLGAALEAAVGRMVAGLRASPRRGKLRVASVQREARPPGLPHVFSLHLMSSVDGEQIRALLHTDALGLMVVAGFAAGSLSVFMVAVCG